MKYLIDTNVLILGVAGHQPDASFMRRAIVNKLVCVSVITVAEFFARASRVEKIALEKLLLIFAVLDIDEPTARQAAQYRRRSLKKTRITLIDCFIAAQAKNHGLTLVTNNQSDFPMRDILIMKP